MLMLIFTCLRPAPGARSKVLFGGDWELCVLAESQPESRFGAPSCVAFSSPLWVLAVGAGLLPLTTTLLQDWMPEPAELGIGLEKSHLACRVLFLAIRVVHKY